MREALLWLDADPKRSLADKVARAAARYVQKFGRRPTTCYVNAADVPAPVGAAQVGGVTAVDGVRVAGADNVLKHHFWIGVEE